TWWLVMTRPSGETKEPEPPLLKRTEDFWTCSSQSLEGSKPYLSLRIFRGGLLNSHRPSSAGAGGGDMVMARPTRHRVHRESLTVGPLLAWGEESGVRGQESGVRSQQQQQPLCLPFLTPDS